MEFKEAYKLLLLLNSCVITKKLNDHISKKATIRPKFLIPILGTSYEQIYICKALLLDA